MTSVTSAFDTYALRARLYPVSLAALPLTTLAALVGIAERPLAATGAVAVFFGVLFFLSSWVRSKGRRLEKRLIERWGGWPTTLALRLTTPVHSSSARAHRRQLLESLLDVQLPNSADEEQNLAVADERYELAVRRLITLVRANEAEHPRVQDENINYGFRRNLLALKGVAVSLLMISLAIDVLFVAFTAYDYWTLGFTIFHLLALCAWIFVVTPAWVREAGEVYADRLFEAMDTLGSN